MIIDWHRHEGDRHALTATPQEYDAYPPLPALIMDGAPGRLDPDRLALAAYLAFGRWCAGDLTLPEQGASPAVAEAIEDDARPVRVRPSPVQYAPRALVRGETEVAVSTSLPADDAAGPRIAVVPSTVAEGRLRTGDATVVASNAFLLDAAAGPAQGFRAHLAVAVLFAEDHSAAGLRLPSVAVGDAGMAPLRALLRSVNLSLR